LTAIIKRQAAISEWASNYNLHEVLASLHEGGIPAGKIYDASDIARDPHYQARDMLLQGTLSDGTPVTLPGIVPKLLSTPGSVRTPAPALGEHTDEVLDELGIEQSIRHQWRARGII